LVTGVAARLFSAPAANVASPQTFNSVDYAVQPMLQPPVIVEVPVPQRSASAGPGTALGVALVAAAVGVVGGNQAMLFLGGGRSRDPTPKKTGNIKVDDRASNRGGPYQARKKNIQIQRNGFGTFVQKFQLASGKSKYGVPIFLPSGAVNPAYLAAERAEMREQSKRNSVKTEQKRKNLIAGGKFELADYIKKAIGEVGSGKDYYQSGR
jgi:hypothetical protein